MFIGYPIRPNYDPSIISTNHPTLKYSKTTKNDQNTPKLLKMTKIPPKTKKCLKYPKKPKKD